MGSDNLHLKFSIVIALLLLLPVSCGLPSLPGLPVAPTLTVDGLRSAEINLPAGTIGRGGIVIYYKILVNPTEDQYTSEYNNLISGATGNTIRTNLESKRYRSVIVNDSTLHPNINYSNYPEFFDPDTLAGGLSSSLVGKKITLNLSADTGLQVLLQENGRTEQTLSLERNSGSSRSRDFVPRISTNYRSGDQDLLHLGSSSIADLVGTADNVYLSIAVFNYLPSGILNENPDQYSFPDIFNWSELFQFP